jgi:arginine/ornithine N-succinyltransferase beta subunit
MRHLPWFATILALPALVLPLQAQERLPRNPLTQDQAHQVAEASIDPPLRVHLYTKFLDEDAKAIEGLSHRADTPARNQLMSSKLEDFADLMDELGSNLDMYDRRMADIRKALKPLDKAVQQWQSMLKNLPQQRGFRISRADAIDSSNDLADQTKHLIVKQDAYFKEHKNQRGQQRQIP